MNVNNMIAALTAKTVDAMVNIEPYNAIAEAEGIGTLIMNFWSVDNVPVFMAATPDFVDKNPDTVVAYLKAWLEVTRDFKENPEQGVGRDLFVLHVQGLHHEARDLRQGAGARRGRSGLPDRPRALHAAETPRCCCRRRRFPRCRTGRRRCGRLHGPRPARSGSVHAAETGSNVRHDGGPARTPALSAFLGALPSPLETR